MNTIRVYYHKQYRNKPLFIDVKAEDENKAIDIVNTIYLISKDSLTTKENEILKIKL